MNMDKPLFLKIKLSSNFDSNKLQELLSHENLAGAVIEYEMEEFSEEKIENFYDLSDEEIITSFWKEQKNTEISDSLKEKFLALLREE